jgi:hypothetical protein
MSSEAFEDIARDNLGAQEGFFNTLTPSRHSGEYFLGPTIVKEVTKITHLSDALRPGPCDPISRNKR